MQTAFTECTECKGGHLQPDLLIVELLDEMNKAVPPGVPGEVTITTLGVEGMPLLRYKTGDICVYDDTPCACGRNSLRLSPVMGRKKQMLKYKGTTLYPPALFDILNEMENVIEYVAEVSSNEMGTDEVLIYILPDKTDEETNRKIRANLQARLRVSPHIKYITEEEIKKIQMPEAGRKIIRFIDRRN
jgi:phenylacetate-CoA ligase